MSKHNQQEAEVDLLFVRTEHFSHGKQYYNATGLVKTQHVKSHSIC